jgi:hypothetical protein
MTTGETQAPARLGPYRLIRKIGEGGMGVVHLGIDEEGREVAIKILHPHVAADLKARDRLTREVETMRRVRSPHVAEVLDAELGARQPYIVTRYAPGRTLEDTVLQDGPLAPDAVIRLARGLCAALVAIHAADVIHRDFKPANVILIAGEPLVIDFGIAHLVNATRLTQTGMFVGTPGYLAPEIIRDAEITQAADVHALASTVFFGATGRPPFGTGAFEAVCYNIMEGRANLDLAPAWLRGWLRLALAVEPRERPSAQSLLRMARALDPSVTPLHAAAAESAVPDGTRVLNGAAPLADGTRVLDDGTRVLADGTRMLSDGTRVLADGTRMLSDGTRVLADGTRMLSDGTRVLDDGTRVLADGTRVLNGDGPAAAQAAAPAAARPGRTRTLPGDDDFADLLPPVNYAQPDRRDPAGRPGSGRSPASVGAAPVGFAPPPPASPPVQAPPYTPGGRPQPPAPYPDQRVAGPPAPPPTGPARPLAPPTTPPRPYTPPPAQGERPRYRTGHPFIAILLLTVVVALACVLPVAVSAFAIVAALCLRVGEHLFGDLTQRRSARGSSGADPLFIVLGTPWALIKSTVGTLVHVPLSAMFGMCVWGVLHYGGDLTTNRAAAYAAAAFTAGLFVLPGGGKPRRAVSRTLTAVVRSPGAAMVAAIILGTVAFFAVMAAMSVTPSFSPWQPPEEVLSTLTDRVRERTETGTMGIVALFTGLIDSLMGSLGLGFLSPWS